MAGLRRGPLIIGSRTCTLGSIGERTGRCHHDDGTSRKADGNQRPLAVAALEDKIVQRATAALLNAIYEEEFLGFSYGFRPRRSQHGATRRPPCPGGTPGGGATPAVRHQWRRTRSDPGFSEDAQAAAIAQLGQEIASFLPHQKAQIELSAINDGLLKAASAEAMADLPLLVFPLRRSLYGLEELASDFDPKLGPRRGHCI